MKSGKIFYVFVFQVESLENLHKETLFLNQYRKCILKTEFFEKLRYISTNKN